MGVGVLSFHLRINFGRNGFGRALQIEWRSARYVLRILIAQTVAAPEYMPTELH